MPEQMRLVINDQQLDDGTINSPKYVRDIPGITNDSTIHLVLKNS